MLFRGVSKALVSQLQVGTKVYLWNSSQRAEKVRFETTLGLSALEPWESAIFLTVFSLFLFLLLRGIYYTFPSYLFVMQKRAVYYLRGYPNTVHIEVPVGATVKDL
ncbi:hypothetical protein V8B97DRAFT_1523233 [Scleroderma yunnanense]